MDSESLPSVPLEKLGPVPSGRGGVTPGQPQPTESHPGRTRYRQRVKIFALIVADAADEAIDSASTK